jgi:hypothetical protein
MSGPLTVPFIIAALFLNPIWAKSLFAALAILCGGASSYAIWRKERASHIAERQKNERPELIGAITSVSRIPVTETGCRIRIEAWIRNDRHVETGVRAVATIHDVNGRSLFIPHFRDESLGLSLKTDRLEYGRRVAGFFPFDVETPMTNVDAKSATVTLIDDFGQTTVLRY